MIKKTIKSSWQFAAAKLGRHRWPSRQPRLWIMMYHRILPQNDPRYAEEEPGMVVTPSTLRRHIEVYQDEFELLHLSEWQARASQGRPLPKRACALTFDDGWQDNVEYGLPILRETATPATVFAVAEMVGTSRRFWPNRLAYLIKHHADALRGLRAEPWLSLAERGGEKPVETREQIAAAISACKRLPDSEIEQHLDALEQTIGVDAGGRAELADWQQLKAMSSDGLVEIGSHTCNHRRLWAALDEQTLRHEIVDSRDMLQERLGTPVKLFCYPNGDVSEPARRLIGNHYEAAVTTAFGINNRQTPAHQLHRIGLHEDGAGSTTALMARLSGLKMPLG